MSVYLVIENGVETNAIEAEAQFASSIGAIPAPDGIGIGFTTTDNVNFTAPVPVDVAPVVDPLTALQQQVSDLQDKVATIQALPLIATDLQSAQAIKVSP